MRVSQILVVCSTVFGLMLASVQGQVPPPTPQTIDPGKPADQPASAVKPEADAAKGSPYLRVVEDKGKSIALEIATRDFVRSNGTGPRVGLVGVAHIGDSAFYHAVQKLLENYDVVLYESVKPPGTGGAGGDTDQQRIDSTKAAMQFVGGMIETEHARSDKYPADLNGLKTYAASLDPRLAKFIQAALTDGWGHQLVYRLKADDDGGGYSLISLGADGKAGGEGANADLNLADQPHPDPLPLSKEDGLQSQLASALGLKFQLDALDYDKQNWRCSDMAMDEVNRRLQAKGLDFSLIGGTLAGTSLSAKLVKVMLNLMKIADSFMGGAITDTFKIVMIELLGDPKLTEMGLDQLGQGFGAVIVQDRNQVAVDDLKKLIEQEPGTKSVAILYGAAHMPDMAAKLAEQLGYQPAPADPKDADSTCAEHWLTAIKVNYADTSMSPAEINQLRAQIKQMIRMQLRAK